jgi:RHS repeat-associated protein
MSPLGPRSTLRSLASRFSLLLALVLSAATLTRAQFVAVTGTTSTPIPGAGHDYIHAVNETVDPGSGSLSVRIQTPVPPGRGLTVPFFFGYDSNGVHELNIQTYPGGNGSAAQWSTTGMVNQIGGWAYETPKISFTSLQFSMYDAQNSQTYYCNVTTGYVFQDSAGTRHQLPIEYAYPTDPNDDTNACQYNANNGVPNLWPNSYISGSDGHVQAFFSPNDPTVTAPFLYVADSEGTVYTFGYMSNYPEQIEDRNGNLVTLINGDPTTHPFTDSLQRSEISISGYRNGGQVGTTVSIAGLTNAYSVTWGTASANWNPNSTLIPGTGSGGSSICRTLPVDNETLAVVTAITLPNGQQYTFDYSNNAYGMVDKITYPTGGYIQYTWGVNPQSASEFYSTTIAGAQYFCSFTYDKPVVLKRQVSFDGSTVALEQDFSYTPVTWTVVGTGGLVNWNSPKTVTVTTYDRARGSSYPGFNTIYNYASTQWGYVPIIGQNLIENPQIPVEQTIQYYNTSNSLLRTETKGWYETYELACDLVTLNDGNGRTGGKFYNYNRGGAVTDLKEYDYVLTSTSSCTNNPTAPSSPLRETLTTYQTFANTPIYANGPSILDRPSSVITYGNGTRIAETDYTYDQTSVASVSATQHDETNYSVSYNNRGNATTVTKQCFPSCSNVVTTYSYDETGQALTMTDPCGHATCSDITGTSHTTTYSYADNYDSPPSGNTNAYLTQITDPLGHTAKFKYAYSDGQLIQSQDQNDLNASRSGTTYSYNDSLRRLTETDYPDGGQTTYAYNDTPPSPSVTTSKLISSGNYLTNVSVMNGMGAPIETELTTDPGGTDYAATIYDGLGKTYHTYNPTRCSPPTTNCGESTWGYTTYNYDALGRPTSFTEQDGSVVSTSYSGNCTTVTDEAGKARTSCSDGLGRLTQVFEDPGASPHLNLETDYAYDALDNLLCVAQNDGGGFSNCASLNSSWRPRIFAYDSISRMITANNPESGTTTYSYDANGNLSSKADARNISTNFGYDALNRLTSKTYSDGTPSASFTYDISSYDGHTLTNPIGRLALEATGDGQTAILNSYDPMGRITSQWQCTPLNCGATPYTGTFTYDSIADLTSESYFYTTGAITISSAFNTAGLPTQVTSNYVDSQHPATLVSGITYTPAGAIQQLTYGNGLADSRAYNDRFQPTQLRTYNPSTGLDVLNMSYGYNAGTADNGNVVSWSASGQQSFSRSYSYDSLNRVQSMSAPGDGCSGLSWTYDAWGNRTAQTATGGSCYQEPSTTFSASNQLPSPYQYDAAGNMTNDGVHTYTYDAENRLTQVDSGSTASYIYDAEGRRARKTTGGSTTDYLRDLPGNIFSTFGPGCGGTGCWTAGALYLNGRFFAQYYNQTTYFVHADHLGSTRVLTGMDQSVCDSLDYLPFGEQIAGDTCTVLKFTGKERDSESGLDNFGARYNSSNMGRFMSPDPSNLSVDFWLPQTWNRYAYVLNNPLTIVDRNGQWPTYIHNEIINEAFPGLSNAELQTLRQASYDTDYTNRVNGHDPQDPEVSFVHGMSDGVHNQDPMQAQQEGDAFIAQNEQNAQQIQADWVAAGNTGIAPGALTAFGNALHTIEDRLSPAHAGNQPWYGTRGARNKARALRHVYQESTINQAQMNAALAAARAAFLRTFGLQFQLLAIQHQQACTTIQGPNGPETHCVD